MRNNWMIIVTLGFAVSLSGCNRESRTGQPLINLRGSSVAPDEFLVIPQKPLETPVDLSSLPTPEPGAGNLVDIDFEQDLIAALGGRDSAPRGIPASEQPLVAASRANGTTDGIRDLMRIEDQAYRNARKGRLERLARKRQAITLYNPMLLDPYAELARLQAMGVKTPAAPPQ